MENLKIDGQSITLVDQVEDKLLNYFKSQDLKVGDSIPNEIELASALGVARSVLREALSRLKMMGMIESRTRRGMILTEPFILGGMKRVVDPRIMSQESLLDLLGFRVALEIGISSDIFHHITEQDIIELEEIVNAGVALGNNEYANLSEYTFHSKLYEITGNKTIDTQHKELIDRIQNFVIACQNGDSKVKAIKLLDYLNEYTDFHFKEEEALQEKAGYPEREKHYEKHEEFKKTIQELYEYLQEYEGPTDRFSELVQKNVIDWLFGHIKTYDRSVAKFIFMKQNPDRC